MDLLPGDKTGFKNNETADATKPEKTEVKVEDGTWKFVSWDQDSKKIEGADVEFLGKWVFTPDEPEPKKIVSADSAAGAAGTAVRTGDEITYEISFMNDSEKTVEVTIVDPLVEGVDFIEASHDGVYDTKTHKVTWIFTEVKPYEKGVVTIKVKVNGKAKEAIVNTANVQIGDKKYDIPEPPSNKLEETSLRVTKVWEDNDDELGIRPDSITVDLYYDGEVVDQINLSEENSWTGFFEKLPLGSTTDTYEIKEHGVDGYSVTYSKVSTEWTIVNKCDDIEETENETKKKTTTTTKTTNNGQGSTSSSSTKITIGGGNPKTGDTTNILIWILLMLAAGNIIIIMKRKRVR